MADSRTSEKERSPFAAMLTDLLHDRTWVSAPEVAPDGRRIAFVVSTIDLDENTTRSRVWLSGPDGDPAPVTAGPHDGQPQWSPDGRFLAFTAKRSEKEEKATLHVLPVGGPGETRTVATLDEGFEDLRWSPDGRRLAFISRTRDARYDAKDESWQPPRRIETLFTRLNGEGWIADRPAHVYVVAADGTGTPRNLTPGPYQHGGISWLPDSSAVVTSAKRHEGWDLDLAEDLYLVPLDGEIRALTSQTGVYGSPSVSPDGTRVALLGYDDPRTEPQNSRVGVLPLAGDDGITWVSTGLDRSFAPYPGVRPPVWTGDTTLLATAEDRGEVHVYEVTADGSSDPKPLTSGPVVVQGFSAAGGTVAMAQARVERPAELVTLDRQITGLTRSLRGWERFAVPCTDGSGEIDAWIMRPDDFEESRRYPVLLNVHGGPFTQYGETFFDEAQMQAAAGFVVLMSNPRGGSGRDTVWGQSIVGPKHPTIPGTGWGSVDVDDVMAVLDHTLDTYAFCDRERVGMLGGSYGGYMATTLAGRFSDRFRAVCSERAVNNMVSEEAASDIGGAFQVYLGVNVAEDPGAYAAMSPMRYAKDIDVPLLILHAEDDLRCPVSQAEELFLVLRLLGKDVTFYRFPGEDHEMSRSGSPVHRRMRGEIVLDFFTERLASRRE
ncbi:S9 family peptidase [Luteipulveratus flavus]|uniref:S9 family peptidase n=1 Tax=Luteipulveratus flavus TaxID=3031728 RepID=A0ABT6C2D7_9MICO|nr:S9 family peptidase [Luteipulveratus sp. YIM 133296]MDF8263089.1 S9 family peptidase [Luteipulveratus sp. YIM 133296]